MRGRGYGASEKAMNLKKRLPRFILGTAAEKKGILGSNLTQARQVLRQPKFL